MSHYRPSGKRAVVAMDIQVLVEVQDTGDYHEMVEQAKEELAKRVVEARMFLPLRMRPDRIYSDVTVLELKTALIVHPASQWKRL